LQNDFYRCSIIRLDHHIIGYEKIIPRKTKNEFVDFPLTWSKAHQPTFNSLITHGRTSND